MAPAQVVVASPGLIKKSLPITTPADCLKYPLLHDIEGKDWEYWLRALGCKPAVSKTGHAFSDNSLLVRAAVAGQGLALVYDTYAATEIAAGKLVQIHVGSWPSKFAYYLVGQPATFRRPADSALQGVAHGRSDEGRVTTQAQDGNSIVWALKLFPGRLAIKISGLGGTAATMNNRPVPALAKVYFVGRSSGVMPAAQRRAARPRRGAA